MSLSPTKKIAKSLNDILKNNNINNIDIINISGILFNNSLNLDDKKKQIATYIGKLKIDAIKKINLTGKIVKLLDKKKSSSVKKSSSSTSFTRRNIIKKINSDKHI